jgi:3-oxoacyl-[acyl-carrier-protein] synthase-3
MNAYLRALACHLPDGVLDNEELVRRNPAWDAEAIFTKTGIRSRRVAAAGETASDLGCAAAERLFEESDVDRAEIDALLFCTQSPDFFLPTTACLIQERLGLPRACGAIDFNLGCSGFTYGLWLARGMIASQSCKNVLLVMGETYSKYCDPHDLGTATIFGDAGAAALISASSAGSLATVGPSIVGTDGRGADNLIVRCGGARMPEGEARLYMNGPEVFSFTLSTVKPGIERLLQLMGIDWEGVDLFLFHQANRFMLEHLRRSMKIPAEKLPIDMEDTGNTVSPSIPLLLRRSMERGLLESGQTCVLVGFGVGYSWAMSALHWGPAD